MGAVGGSRARLTMQTVPDASGLFCCKIGAWTASPRRTTGARKKGPYQITQVAASVGGYSTAPPRCTTRGWATFQVQPPTSTTHHVQLKQRDRDPATSVAEPCSIPAGRPMCLDAHSPPGLGRRRFSPQPPGPLQARQASMFAPLTFSFEKDTLVVASTPDPCGLRFARVRSVPLV
ncbi:hypothetical protein PMIN01_02814 [Paraphaeosphaeria minitans]|uniref:Uncharacterized protein n=1 Tax=Paraphaeosphaeria minitans TaxID=565426 RepID=A0A9P6GTY7_9PLEO|nr:hypothetical protein PMIN01_02814 [Paraphaeosphaeria minitans]